VRACIVATRGREIDERAETPGRRSRAQGDVRAQAAGTSTGPHVAHESGDLSVGLGSRPRRAPGVAVRMRDCTQTIVSVSVTLPGGVGMLESWLESHVGRVTGLDRAVCGRHPVESSRSVTVGAVCCVVCRPTAARGYRGSGAEGRAPPADGRRGKAM
jgi:hypothetical protein